MRDSDFDKQFSKFAKAGVAATVISLLIGLAVTGVFIWAIIKLVTHFLG